MKMQSLPRAPSAARDSPLHPTARERLAATIAASDLPVYVYSYPSKRAYRPLESSQTLERIWRGVQEPVNLYVHIPFCGYRCSFCTLFLTTTHTDEVRQRYVESLQRQIALYGRMLGDVEVVSLYFGGGTPTVLEPAQFEALFSILREAFPVWLPDAEIAVEGSPDTMRRELLAGLKDLGVNRISMGLQTLDPHEAEHVGRRYGRTAVHAAVEAIGSVQFDNVNYDLIYGLEGQTRESWLRSLRATIGFEPSTMTLYPVVVRPLTAIEKRRARHEERFIKNASKYALYDESVALLAERGFRQNSFVRFSRRETDGLQQEVSDFSGVPLIGFGAGSRSYSGTLHYGTDFAVRRRPTEAIITSFIEREHRADEVPRLGFALSPDEERRRHCILNLSLGELDARTYRQRFDRGVHEDFGAELDALTAERCVVADAGGYRLTPMGFKYSNVIGALFKSRAVTDLEAAFVPT